MVQDEEKRKTMGVEEGGRDFGTEKIILHTWPLITAHNSSNFFLGWTLNGITYVAGHEKLIHWSRGNVKGNDLRSSLPP